VFPGQSGDAVVKLELKLAAFMNAGFVSVEEHPYVLETTSEIL
jgi:hypothetical protein